MSFSTVRIGELVARGTLLVADGHRMRNDELGRDGIPFVRGGDIGNDGSVNTQTVDHIRPEFADRIKNKLSQPGDTVFITKGTVGRAGYLRPNQPSVVFSPQVALWRVLDRNQLSPRFIYYLICSREFQNALDGVKTHGAMAADYVSISLQHDFRFNLPDVGTQYAIANILGSLDDKIELNRRMNETLEATAQAIFRDWFVDFGPTRRKLAGITEPVKIMGDLTTDPARAAELAALFPAAFGENGLPSGWNDHLVEDALTLAYGKSLTKTVRGEGEVPVYGSGGITGTHSTALVRGPGIIVGRKGTVGSLYWEDRDFFPIDTVFYVEPKRPLAFCYYLLQTLGLERMNTDAAVPGLNRTNVYRLSVPYDEPATEAFSARVDVLRLRIGHNERERQNLAATRDLLLPKLMSGEIRLRDAEVMAAGAL